MSKDHIPSDFSRTSGYKSDLENAETDLMVKSINTSFGSKNHNAYIMRSDGTHEHFFYDPQNQKSGWHGHRYETKNNHPTQNLQAKGEKKMSNEFLDSLKVDKDTLARLDDVSRNAAKNNSNSTSKAGKDDGGREIGDEGPGSLGRESGYKGGNSNTAQSSGAQNTVSNSSSGNSTGGQGSGGQGSGGQGSGGGHGGH